MWNGVAAYGRNLLNTLFNKDGEFVPLEVQPEDSADDSTTYAPLPDAEQLEVLNHEIQELSNQRLELIESMHRSS